MKDEKYIKFSWYVVIMAFVVILAGGLVRMSQSGMGCPDWPKCFGRWIPPLNENQLPGDYEKYLHKQDIDHSFNVYHTWGEYFNRLCGATLGLFILVYLYKTVKKFRRSDNVMIYVSVALLFFVMLEGYLGKVVVDKNLEVNMITIHMLGAIIIAILPIYNIVRFKTREYRATTENIRFKWIYFILMGLLLLQIILGTDVRESIDVISKEYGYQMRSQWIKCLGTEFYIHRSFSWLVLLMSGYGLWKSRETKSHKYFIMTFSLVLGVIIFGVIMAYFSIPAFVQPLHMILAIAIFVQMFYSWLVLGYDYK